MSKAAKQGILILGILLLVSLGFGGFQIMEKQKVESARVNLEQQLTASKKQEGQYVDEIQKLRTEIKQVQGEKIEIQNKVVLAEQQAQQLNEQLQQISDEKDKCKGRIDNITKERDELMSKLQALNEQVASLEKQKTETPKIAATTPSPAPNVGENLEINSNSPMEYALPSTVDEAYWASLEKEKADLEVKLNSLKDELSQNSIQIVELKQDNEELKIELEKLNQQKDELMVAMKHKDDLVNNLSLELARTKNDKKFVSDQVGKLNEEAMNLRKEMKKMIAAKGALEKSIVKVTEEKNRMERDLGKTETIVQSKIDEIWEIKEDLDKTFQQARNNASSDGEIELPPIVVSSDGDMGASSMYDQGNYSPGFNGKVVSVNDDSNFVIVNLGEKSGLKLGDTLSVYRDKDYIAKLEIIQVRKDISAADIKEQWTKVQEGDEIH